jgi:hypothetical protein
MRAVSDQITSGKTKDTRSKEEKLVQIAQEMDVEAK